MNYAVVILLFVFLLATGYWFIRGRTYYTGPRTRAHVIDGTIIADDGVEAVQDVEKTPAGLNSRVPHLAAEEL